MAENLDDQVVALICQFLDERGFTDTLKSLQTESGRKYNSEPGSQRGMLQSIISEHLEKQKALVLKTGDVKRLFSEGDNCFAKACWTSLEALTGGSNILFVRLYSDGELVFTTADRRIYSASVPVPLPAPPPEHLFTDSFSVSKAAILCFDRHPIFSNLSVLVGMDRIVYMVLREVDRSSVVVTFNVHKKYIIHCCWAPSGRHFVTTSYDKTVCVYSSKGERPPADLADVTKEDVEGMKFEMVKQLPFKGPVECVAMRKDSDIFVVGCREDHLLHVFKLEQDGQVEKIRVINLNVLEDDFVSFTPMCISFSPDEKSILVSTDRNRLILILWENGFQLANYYGAPNDDLSTPRHCWHPSGLYIYSTAQDRHIYVWETRSGELKHKLEGHTDVIRGICYCKELDLLVTCGFDGSIRMWRDDGPLVKAVD